MSWHHPKTSLCLTLNHSFKTTLIKYLPKPMHVQVINNEQRDLTCNIFIVSMKNQSMTVYKSFLLLVISLKTQTTILNIQICHNKSLVKLQR